MTAPDWGVVLTDQVDTTLTIHLGYVQNFDSLKHTYESKVGTYIPMGSRYPKDFPARAQYKDWTNLQWDVPPVEVLSDGTIVDNETAIIDVLEQMAPPRLGLTKWEDYTGFVTYGKILVLAITPVDGSGWTVDMAFSERKPPG